MKKFVKLAVAVLLLVMVSPNVSAQGFFKKMTKAVDKVGKTLGTKDAPADTAKVELSKTDSILLSPMKFEVKRVTVYNEAGDSLNADGTVRYSYRVVDENNKVYDPGVVEQMVDDRTKAYTKILAKVGGGAALGAVGGLLSGGSKKEVLTGVGVGAAVGLLSSINNIKTIRSINKDIKQLKSVLEAYKQTFTDEGLPKDVAADLSNVNGIDFTQCATISKPMAEVQAEMEASKNMDIPNLDDLQI